jgi:putative tricarboxylic transport membrane protein
MFGGGRATGEILLGAALVVAGLLFFWGTSEIHVAPTYSKVGPRVFPFAVAGGLVLLGILYLLESWRGIQTPTDEHTISIWPVAVISAGIVLDALLFEWLGFILSSALLFLLVAIGFGSRMYLRDLVLGFALATAAYFTFVYGLGLSLPSGILAGWS